MKKPLTFWHILTPLLLTAAMTDPHATSASIASPDHPSVISSKMKAHLLRLKPGQDLLAELEHWAKQNKIKAAAIVTTVGSFKKINLRYANEENGTAQTGYFEIVSVVGTFNESSSHLHVSVSNSKGVTFGGHLLSGNLIYTTAEIVVTELEDVAFTRKADPKDKGGSGYDELVVKPFKL